MGIQMNRKGLTKTFMMILNGEKPFGIHGLQKYLGIVSVYINPERCQGM